MIPFLVISRLMKKNPLKYIATLTKGKTIVHVMEILMDYLLPHIGENNFNGYTNTVVVGKIAKISAPSSRISEYFFYRKFEQSCCYILA